MKLFHWTYRVTILFFSFIAFNASASEIEIPTIFIQGIEKEFFIEVDPNLFEDEAVYPPMVQLNGKEVEYEESEAGYTYYLSVESASEIEVRYGSQIIKQKVKPIPIWLSIIPPLIAIVLALIIKEVVTALFLGLFFGSFIIQFFSIRLLKHGSLLF